MNYLSLFSGIESATVAFEPLGWKAVAYAEIDKPACAVLAHRYPNTPNWGNVEKYKTWPDASIDVLIGGSPCQSFSVAGLRKGMDDPRGNLALVYLAIADRYKPEWLIYENVPGLLSSNGGRDFGSFLGGLGELGYGFAYRVLDAQYARVDGFERAVPQRRRRVFVVGHLGDWRRAAAVLFDREGMCWNPPPSREARKKPPVDLAQSIELGRIPPVSHALNASTGGDAGKGAHERTYVPEIMQHALSAKLAKGTSGPAGDEHHNLVAHSLRADGYDASEDGSGRGTPIVPVMAFGCKDSDPTMIENVSPTLRGMEHGESRANGGGQVAIAIQERAISMSENTTSGPDGGGFRDDGAAFTLENRHTVQAVAFDAAPGIGHNSKMEWAVRRLMPVECERLQGAPDNHTLVPFGNKMMADGPRYKMLGNAMPANTIRLIGRRIQAVEELMEKSK